MNKSKAQKVAHDIATIIIREYPYSGPYCNFNPISVGAAAYCAAFDSLLIGEGKEIAIARAIDAIVNDIYCYCKSCYQPYKEFDIGKRDY